MFKEASDKYVKESFGFGKLLSEDGLTFVDAEGRVRIKLRNTPRMVEESIGYIREAEIVPIPFEDFIGSDIDGMDRALDFKDEILKAFRVNGIVGLDEEHTSCSSYTREYMPLTVNLRNAANEKLGRIEITEEYLNILDTKWDTIELYDVCKDLSGELRLQVKVNGQVQFA